MNNHDWSLSIGIGHFTDGCGLDPLPGAVRDAQHFDSWLGEQSGGGVPDAQRRLVVSSQVVSPTTSDVMKELTRLYESCMSNLNAGNGFRLGRRLWLYFSGHGVSLNGERSMGTGILTAEAKPSLGIYSHVNAQIFADFFRDAPGFDEVILIMDCCRSSLKQIVPQPLIWARMLGEPQARSFYAFAVADGIAAREVETSTGPAGIFSTRMLEVFKEPREERLTARELGEILDGAFDNQNRPDIYPPRLARLDFPIIGPSRHTRGRQQSQAATRLVIVDEQSDASVALADEFLRDATLETIVLNFAEVETRPSGSLQSVEQLVFARGKPSVEAIAQVIASVRPKKTLMVSEGTVLPGIDAEQMTTQACARPSLEVARANAKYLGAASAGCDLYVAGNSLARLRLKGQHGGLYAEDFGNLEIQGLPYGQYLLSSDLVGQRVERELLVVKPQQEFDLPHVFKAGPFFIGKRLLDSAKISETLNMGSAPLLIVQTGSRTGSVSLVSDRNSVKLRSNTYHDSSNGKIETCQCSSPDVLTRALVTYPITESLLATVSIPVVAGWRTEIYVDVDEQTKESDLAIRIVRSELPIGETLLTDSIRETIRKMFANRGVMPNVRVDVHDLKEDPIAMLLAIGLDIANGHNPSDNAVDLAKKTLGTELVDVSALHQPTRLWSSPLLSTTWFHALARNRIKVKHGSPSEQLAGRLLATEPWLTLNQAEEFHATNWLCDVAQQIWPGWDRDADADQLRNLPEIQSAIGASADFIKQTSYKTPPVESLVNHNRIAFVGATNDQLLQALALAFALRKGKRWTKLALWFLIDDRLSTMKSAGRSGKVLLEKRDEMELRFSALLPIVAESYSIHRYNIFEVNGRWHFASFWDWDRPGGYIHLSPYTEGADVRTAKSEVVKWDFASPPTTQFISAVHSYELLQNCQ